MNDREHEASAESTEFVLRVVNGRDTGRVLTLDWNPRTIGRLPSADFHTSEHFASRIHLEIVWNHDERRHEVTCHGRYGAVVDGKLLREGDAASMALRPGTVIVVGGTHFAYERNSGA